MRSDKKLLTDFVTEVLTKVLAEGDVKHADVDWVTPSVGENLNHAYAHYKAITTTQPGMEEHFEHLLCRAAMALYKRRHP